MDKNRLENEGAAVAEQAEIAALADEALMPALLFGLVGITGPIGDQDRARAKCILAITKSREAAGDYLRTSAVRTCLEMALGAAVLRGTLGFDLNGPTRVAITEQIGHLVVPAGPNDLADEMWDFMQARRVWAENILAGKLPNHP